MQKHAKHNMVFQTYHEKKAMQVIQKHLCKLLSHAFTHSTICVSCNLFMLRNVLLEGINKELSGVHLENGQQQVNACVYSTSMI